MASQSSGIGTDGMAAAIHIRTWTFPANKRKCRQNRSVTNWMECLCDWRYLNAFHCAKFSHLVCAKNRRFTKNCFLLFFLCVKCVMEKIDNGSRGDATMAVLILTGPINIINHRTCCFRHSLTDRMSSAFFFFIIFLAPVSSHFILSRAFNSRAANY